ncbi:MAG: hypothetical protein IKA57_01655 [Clostridia bacterium]|nr:hypothetical protein [Clostridia bacterium]
MKVLRKNKHGAAMESAVLFMFVVLMLGMLLTGVAMLTHLRVKVNNTALTREIAIEQIGDNFVHGTAEFENLTDGDHTIDNYVAAITTEGDGTRILTLKTKNDKLLLHVEVPKDSTTPSVWKYTE